MPKNKYEQADVERMLDASAEYLMQTFISGGGLEGVIEGLKTNPMIGGLLPLVMPMLGGWVEKVDKQTLRAILYKVFYKAEFLDELNGEAASNEISSGDAKAGNTNDGDRANG